MAIQAYIKKRIGLPTRLEHIRDVKEIARMGIVGVPALVINGKVKCSGNAPSRGSVKDWLLDLRQSEA
jgi:hypothetical protein